jgi:hypothetical protein
MAAKGPVLHRFADYKEPERESRTHFSLPTLAGHEMLRELVSDYGGIDRTSKDLKIAADLLNRYLSGQLEPPYTLLLALYWQSCYGFKQAFAESHWTHQYNTFRRHEAEAKVAHLERVVGHAVSLLEHRTDAAEMVRQSLSLAGGVSGS